MFFITKERKKLQSMNNRMRYLLTASLAALALSNVSAQQKTVSIEDLYFDSSLASEEGEYIPMNDGERYAYTIDGRKIVATDYATGKTSTTLLDLDELGEAPISQINGFIVSPDASMLLVYEDSYSIYRYSFSADYYLYNIKYKTFDKLTEKGSEQNPQFSPTSSMIAFAQDNNLYIKKLKYNSVSAVTTDGKRNLIINGVADWVYEEEFECKSAFSWSADGKELAYIRFDESQALEYPITYFKASYPEYENSVTYPTLYAYKYPKAGSDNSKVSVCVYNVDTRKTKTIDTGSDTDIYIPRIEWTGNEKELAIMRLNRRQNKLDLMLANTASTVSNTILTDKNERYIDVDAFTNFRFIDGGKMFVLMSERDGYNQLYLYGINGVERGRLTDGKWDVTAVCGYDPTTRSLIYQAAKENSIERDLYSVNIDTYKTTALTTGGGTYSADVDPAGKYFVRTFSNAQTPPVEAICDARGAVKRTTNSNTELKNTLKRFKIQPKEFFTFKNSNGDLLNGWIIKPTNFEAGKKYPVLLMQYSGPNSQEVRNMWELNWEQSLAAAGYAVACVDPRGTGCRGEEFRKCTYKKLGILESDDQADAARYLGSLSYIDSKRIGIWGWSFGGYTATMSLCRSDVFKVGIAVAPVTNWRYYDTVYTERYMQRPEENAKGYENSSPTQLAANLRGRLFLIQGVADDNVHLQNQMEFVDALAINGKIFDMFTYPNRDHSIYGGPIRLHLFNMLMDYVSRNL